MQVAICLILFIEVKSTIRILLTLSTLNISSHDFVFYFPSKSHTNGDGVPYKSMIIPLISQCGTTPPNNP